MPTIAGTMGKAKKGPAKAAPKASATPKTAAEAHAAANAARRRGDATAHAKLAELAQQLERREAAGV